MRLSADFFIQDAEKLARELIGKVLIRTFADGHEMSLMITETEAYTGEHDLACHTSKGRTARTDPMYHRGGILYVYLVYGMYQMLNVVSGPEGLGQAVLIRGAGKFDGPGKLTRALAIGSDFNRECLLVSTRIRIEDQGYKPEFIATPRIGIDYAGDYWKSQALRFVVIA
ncbi:MAG TPA: DNA-3-methyladenine glycosylase [Bacteroidales bacterium]|nr:DNA-3-methyladenine glycosylase [Bacteroidales bacterium]